ncbi:ABC transporter ATP-binding protein [Arvimicrobium flavum]|uniref:ABC transporter ATP-binding protein n=1 Tax=Arvimicrobium flavum TaxID=3393320 RepID=UPI00237BDCB2|nr:ABC transporter ATP-binding protein [Mesorhizobium shangrilense]
MNSVVSRASGQGYSGSPSEHRPVSSRSVTLCLDGVTKTYGGRAPVVDALSLELPPGKLLGLLGPSGCGKSTTLRMIAGLIGTSSGRILVNDEDIAQMPPHKRDIGLVFQSYALFPHMSVGENVAFGLSMRGVKREEANARVEEALAMVRLEGYAARKPREMSGGQQQRVALARALVIRPRILLLDEPLSNLDAKLREEMRLEIREIQKRLSITTLFVTHDQTEALTMCDLVGVMANGRIAQLGTAKEIYERPSSLFVAEFVGRTNVLPCEILGQDIIRMGSMTYKCRTGDLASGTGKAAIRPHRISISPDRDLSLVSNVTNTARAKVTRVTYVGETVQYQAEIDGATFLIEVPTTNDDRTYSAHDKVLCEWKPDDMVVFRG